MKSVRSHWQLKLALILIISSITVYFVHCLIFRDIYHLLFYFLSEIAFIPVEVLFVTLIIHNLLEQREKRQIIQKMNMVIGVFFSEAGNFLLSSFFSIDDNSKNLSSLLKNVDAWDTKKFAGALQFLKSYNISISVTKKYLSLLKKELIRKRTFLLTLLENPNLLEHDEFTDLLWAVFHLTEELEQRRNFLVLPENDLEHLRGDTIRAYRLLLREWVLYMKHLKEDYPYLYSLAVRTSVFNPESGAVFK